MLTRLLHLLLLLFSLHIRLSDSINVVVFLPGTNDDERRLLNRLAQELAFRNHKVCAFKAVIVPEQKYLVQPKLHDVRELKLKPEIDREIYEPVKYLGNDETFWNVEYDRAGHGHEMPIWRAYSTACKSIIDSDLMDRLRDELYDVAVVYAGNPCHLGVVHALAMPFIYFDTQGYTDEMVLASGSMWLPSLPLYPGSSLPLGIAEKIDQIWTYVREYSAFSNHTWLMQRLLPRWRHLDEPITTLFQKDNSLKRRIAHFPNVNEIKKTAAAFFVNSDRALEMNGRSEVPNLVYVGGMHLEYPRPMFPPFNITNALAKDGVIIMSMGTVVNGTMMPTWMKRAFLKAFARFPTYRIYWRLGSATLGDEIAEDEIPKNINFTQFIPQNDMLAADETMLFISNGGANSIMEAINYGVPVLGIPLYGLNQDNLKKLESKGAAIVVQKSEISARSIYEAMRKLLKEEKYFNNAQRLSRMFKDRQTSPLETAIHWVEYVGRHHGAKRKRLQKPLANLSIYEYLMLDVLAVILLGLWISLKVTRNICTVVFGEKPGASPIENSESQIEERAALGEDQDEETFSEESDEEIRETTDVKRNGKAHEENNGKENGNMGKRNVILAKE